MPTGDYDLAGFCVGAVDRDKVLTGDGHRARRRHPRARQLGRPSATASRWSGGSSPTKAGSSTRPCLRPADERLARPCSTPTRIYVRSLLPLVQQGRIKGLAHITGGGILENIPRVLPDGCHADDRHGRLGACRRSSRCSSRAGGIEPGEMARTFNCGIGMAVIVGQPRPRRGRRGTRRRGRDGVADRPDRGRPARLHRSRPSGQLERRRGLVREAIMADPRRVAILISGRGSNMRALVEQAAGYEVVLVASNKPQAEGLDWARARGLPTWAFDSKGVERDAFDSAARRRARRPSRRHHRAGRLHAHPLARLRQPIRRADRQHPPLAPAQVSRPRHAPAGARRRRQGQRLHRPPRHRGARFGRNPRPGEVPIEPGDTAADSRTSASSPPSICFIPASLSEFVAR